MQEEVLKKIMIILQFTIIKVKGKTISKVRNMRKTPI